MAEFIVTFVVGVALGIGLMILYIAYRFKMIFNELDQYIEQAADSVLLGIRVEKHNGMYLFYRASDNQFVFQTNTLDNLREAFSRQFPNKTCYIEDGDSDAVDEIRQVLKQ